VVPSLGALSERDQKMLDALKASPAVVENFFELYRFRDGVAEAMNLARVANKYFNDSEPWKSVKTDPAQCATTLHICLQITRSLAILFAPIVPTIAKRMWAMLKCEGDVQGAEWHSAGDTVLKPGQAFESPTILIPKIEDDTMTEILSFVSRGAEESPKPTNTITIDDFKKIDLRVANIISAERVAKSEKLLKLQIEFGTERRQIVAGIAKHYAPEELVGKQIVVVANLQPTKLMGLESQGMLLAANGEDGSLALIAPSKPIASASVVR